MKRLFLGLTLLTAVRLAAAADFQSAATSVSQSSDSLRAANALFDNDTRAGRAPATSAGAAHVGVGAGTGELAGGTAASDATQSRYMRAADGGAVPGVGGDPKIITSGLRASELEQRGYTPRNIADLKEGIRDASSAVSALHKESLSWISQTSGSGVMTNVAQSFEAPFSTHPFALGSVAHQRATLQSVPKGSSIEYEPVATGKVVERHAVVAFPRPPSAVTGDPSSFTAWWKDKGVVLDGWPRQSAEPDKMVYPSVSTWQSITLFSTLAGPRLEKP